jgi:hypothetical protein
VASVLIVARMHDSIRRVRARHPMHQVLISASQPIVRGIGSHVPSSKDEFNPSYVSSSLSRRCKKVAGVYFRSAGSGRAQRRYDRSGVVVATRKENFATLENLPKLKCLEPSKTLAPFHGIFGVRKV